ncbi:MAG: SIS domain-containing protein [Oscillospiraceae bacterium]|nr:SIS domain-containing protein [Oscillospiraceae bacterium]
MNSITILDDLVSRYPILNDNKSEILVATECIYNAFASGKKILVAGNGGSAADAEHIVGELMKSFVIRNRVVEPSIEAMLLEKYGDDGSELAKKLEGALPAIPLTGFIGLATAFANDVDPQVSFAQQVYGLGHEGDIFLAISTSGNSRNLINALMVADAKGLVTIGLTGRNGGMFNNYCHYLIHAPEDETYKIQELHLPIYHTICLMLEFEFFGG